MNYRGNYCVLDWETSSKNKYKCQPTSLSAVMMSARKLEVMPNGIFNSLVRPELDDAKALALGMDPLTEEVLKLTHLTREQLAEAPIESVVWDNFCCWLKQFSESPNQWDFPILCGYNIINYDCAIIDRMCQKYGPWDETYQSQKLFHPLYKVDLLQEVFKYTENMKINSNNSISMDSVRKWLGINGEGSHASLKDVFDTAFLMRKFINFSRYASKELIEWPGCFEKENEEIKKLMEKYS